MRHEFENVREGDGRVFVRGTEHGDDGYLQGFGGKSERSHVGEEEFDGPELLDASLRRKTTTTARRRTKYG